MIFSLLMYIKSLKINVDSRQNVTHSILLRVKVTVLFMTQLLKYLNCIQ